MKFSFRDYWLKYCIASWISVPVFIALFVISILLEIVGARRFSGYAMDILMNIMPFLLVIIAPACAYLLYLTVLSIGADVMTAQKNAYLAAIQEAKKDDD